MIYILLCSLDMCICRVYPTDHSYIFLICWIFFHQKKKFFWASLCEVLQKVQQEEAKWLGLGHLIAEGRFCPPSTFQVQRRVQNSPVTQYDNSPQEKSIDLIIGCTSFETAFNFVKSWSSCLNKILYAFASFWQFDLSSLTIVSTFFTMSANFKYLKISFKTTENQRKEDVYHYSLSILFILKKVTIILLFLFLLGETRRIECLNRYDY